MKWWNQAFLYTTNLCVQTMHTRRIRPSDTRQKRCP